MAGVMSCPHCQVELYYADQLDNETIRCWKCEKVIPVSELETRPNSESNPPQNQVKKPKSVSTTAAPATQKITRAAAREAELPVPKRRKKKKRGRGIKIPGIAIDPGIMQLVRFGLYLVIAGVLIFFGVRSLLKASPPEVIPESQWHEVTLGDRFRVSLPGSSRKVLTDIGTGLVQMSVCTLENETYYRAGFMPQKQAVDKGATAESLLKQFCDGYPFQANYRDRKAKELSRKPIQFGNYQGQELVLQFPKMDALEVVRVYWIDDSICILAAGGRGMTENHDNLKRFFGSLTELADTKKPLPVKTDPAPPLKKKDDSKSVQEKKAQPSLLEKN